MKLESVIIDDTLAATVDRLWPDATWSEVVEYALALAVDCARTADDDEHHVLHGDEHHEVIDVLDDDLEQRMAAAFAGNQPAQ